MPPSTQTWFINGRCLGTFPVSQERTHNELHRARSYAFACPHCGEVWARRLVPSSPWFFWTVCCESCIAVNRNSLTPPGSIYLAWDDSYTANLPLPVLRYEAELLCKHRPVNF